MAQAYQSVRRRRYLSRFAPLAVLVVTACHRGSPPATNPTPQPRTSSASGPRPAPPPPQLSDTPDSTYLRRRALMVPVEGIAPAKLYDSFLDKRGENRVHHAVDILAPRGTPVLAADDGRVLRMRENKLGGITIYAVDPAERFVYYYAHLSRYAKTLSEGQIVSKGEVIGYVGTTGDAPKNVPHLHFQIMKRPATARWWDGVPIDPVPYLMLPGAIRDP